MLRIALLTTVVLAGALFFQAAGLFAQDEAWLVAGAVAAGLLFLIPVSGEARDPKTLIFSLVSVIAIHGIFLKLRPWLAFLVGQQLAAVLSILLILALAAAVLLLPSLKQVNCRANTAR